MTTEMTNFHLISTENGKTILNTHTNELNNFAFKLKTSSNSIDILSQMIHETDLKIVRLQNGKSVRTGILSRSFFFQERVKKEIFTLSEKISRISNDIMTTPCSLSNDDESKLIHRQ